MVKYNDTFYRVANRAFLRNGDIEYTDEALMLALLLHAVGKEKRGSDEEKYVARLLEDPNQTKKR